MKNKLTIKQEKAADFVNHYVSETARLTIKLEKLEEIIIHKNMKEISWLLPLNIDERIFSFYSPDRSLKIAKIEKLVEMGGGYPSLN